MSGCVFTDRADAGRRLAERLVHLGLRDPLVLALPRGGVPVAFPVAQALGAPLDLLLVRKIGVPGHQEFGLGAVVDGAHPQVVLNEEVMRRVNPSDAYIEAQAERQLAEIERRRRHYLGDRPPVDTAGRDIIIVDDGIATGGTVRAALEGVARARPSRIVLAVPVAPAEAIDMLKDKVDEIVCLEVPDPFMAVGLHYKDFTQTTDAEVVRLLDDARS